MAAIQQIQNLIALSQPIPPDLQVAALLEAQQQGLSSSALAGVFGVPESMVLDSVSALGLGGQLSPNLGGTLSPATKFDNNVGVVSGRTAAAQESQPIELAPLALLPEGYGTTLERPIAGGFGDSSTFFQDLDDQDRREFLQDLQEGIFSSGMGMLNQQTLTDMAVNKLIGDNSLLTSSLNPETKVILDQIGLETSAGAILKQIVDSLSRGEELSAGNFFSGTTPSEYQDLTNTLRTDNGFVAGTAPVFTTGDAITGESGEMANLGGKAARDYYANFTPEEIAAMQAANAAVLDVPLNVAQGALMGTEMLTNVAGANNAASQTLGEWQDVLGDMMSDQSKLDKQEISRIMSEAEGTGAWNEIKAAAEAFGVAPIDFVSNALGTTLPVIAATAVSGGGILPATVVGAATGVGTAKGAIYDATKQEMLNQGMTEEQANQIASDAQSYGGENLAEILISGGFGALAGSTGVEASVSRILQGLGKGGAATIVKGAAGEGLGEFGEGGAEQYATNKALQELGLDVTDFQGVVGNATLESLAGANTGGGISAIEAAGEGGTEGIADTGNNLQLVKDFNEAYNRNLDSLSNNVESLTTTGLENELTSNTLGSEITGLEDTSGAATRDLNTSPKNINEVTEAEINEFESALEEVGLTGETTQTTQTTQTTAQQSGNKVAALSSVSNKAIALFGAGAAAIAAVVYAANKSGASAAEVAAATNMTVDQVNKLASEAGQTINNQGNTLTVTGEAATAAEQAAADAASEGMATVENRSSTQAEIDAAAARNAQAAASTTTDSTTDTNTLSNVVTNCFNQSLQS
jgi:hypothetical protein